MDPEELTDQQLLKLLAKHCPERWGGVEELPRVFVNPKATHPDDRKVTRPMAS